MKRKKTQIDKLKSRIVLIVNSEPQTVELFAAWQELYGRNHSIVVADVASGIRVLDGKVQLAAVIADLNIPDSEGKGDEGGLVVLRHARKVRGPDIKLSLISGKRDVRAVEEALELGAQVQAQRFIDVATMMADLGL